MAGRVHVHIAFIILTISEVLKSPKNHLSVILAPKLNVSLSIHSFKSTNTENIAVNTSQNIENTNQNWCNSMFRN